MLKYLKKIAFYIVVAGLIYSLVQSILNYQKKIQFFQNYKKDYQTQVDKNKKLKSESLKRQDYYTVEKDIREKLNLLQPDEIAIILPHPTPSPTPTPEVKKPPFRQWWDLFTR